MWVTMSLLGSLPFMLALDMSFPDALFESASGYTTTGSTVIVGLDDLAPSILFYRQVIQWLGGIGVIVLAVALLPMLRIGGMQLYRAEMPGPAKHERITPRIAGTARTLVVIYAWMTVACAACFCGGRVPEQSGSGPRRRCRELRNRKLAKQTAARVHNTYSSTLLQVFGWAFGSSGS